MVPSHLSLTTTNPILKVNGKKSGVIQKNSGQCRKINRWHASVLTQKFAKEVRGLLTGIARESGHPDANDFPGFPLELVLSQPKGGNDGLGLLTL